MIGEYFFDHARIERMFFDGVLQARKRRSDSLTVPGLALVSNSNARTLLRFAV